MAQTLMGGYQQNVINPVSGLLEPYIGQGPATAQQVANNALTIMSPYSQAVIDPALKIGQQQLQQNLRTIGSAANQAGAFGGTRQGVQEGVAQSQAALGAGQYVGDLLQKGWTSALTPAQAIALQGGQQSFNATNALAGLYGTGYQGAQGAAQNIMNQNLQTGMTATAAGPALAMQQQAQRQKEASMLADRGRRAAEPDAERTERRDVAVLRGLQRALHARGGVELDPVVGAVWLDDHELRHSRRARAAARTRRARWQVVRCLARPPARCSARMVLPLARWRVGSGGRRSTWWLVVIIRRLS